MSLRQMDLLLLLKNTVKKWNADNCLRLGASLSYYTLFSIFPLILVVLFIIKLAYFNSDAARDSILDALTSVTGGFRDDFLATLEAASQTRQTSGILGSIMLVLGASWVFGELVSAFNIFWVVESHGRGGPMEFVRMTFSSLSRVQLHSCYSCR
jgi:membrane protein